MQGLGRFYELEITCQGEPDSQTGYFINIKAIDEATRNCMISAIAQAVDATNQRHPGAILAAVACDLSDRLHSSVRTIRWSLTPFLNVSIEVDDMTHCVIREQFSFAASHRLHCPELSSAENEDIFGKCNNPNGHGHNYRIDVATTVDLSIDPVPPFNSIGLERVVQSTILDRFDHRNLNVDCPEFEALNPSVENIARVCYDLLAPEVSHLGISLHHVTIWETEKTSCTYPG